MAKRQLLSIDKAFQLTHRLQKDLGLNKQDTKLLEEAILACPTIEANGTSFLDYKTFQAVLENLNAAFSTGDLTRLTRERGYVRQPVDIEEFLDSPQYMDLKGSIRPIIRKEMVRLFQDIDMFTEIVCLHGDTEIPLLSGEAKTMRELAELGGDVWLISWHDGSIIPTLGRNPRKTGTKEIWRVEFDDGSYIEATEDHMFLERGAGFIRVCDMVPGTRLQSIYGHDRGIGYKNAPQMYRFISPDYKHGADRGFLHHITARHLYGDYTGVVHHKDRNTLNNEPDNIEILTPSEHSLKHVDTSVKNFRDYNKTLSKEEIGRRTKKGLDVQYSSDNREYYCNLRSEQTRQRNLGGLAKIASDAFWSSEKGDKRREDLSEYAREFNATSHPNLRNDITIEAIREVACTCSTVSELARALNCSDTKIRTTITNSGISYRDFRDRYMAFSTSQHRPRNHKVARVYNTGRVEDVYCLTVDIYHNFFVNVTGDPKERPISSIISHNCGGSTGIGKSFFCELSLLYLVYLDSCLISPQAEYGLAPGSSIIYVFQSVSLTTAKRVLFDQMSNRLARSPYFTKVYPYDKKVKTEVRFPNNVRIVPVSGGEFSALGLNVKGVIMSECNYMQVIEDSKHAIVGETYDQAERNYTVLKQRMKGRFGNRGKVFLDSAAHYPGDFLDRKFEEAEWNKEIFSFKYAQWDVLTGLSDKKFLVEVGNAERNSRIIQSREEAHPSSQVLEVPINYLTDFQRNVEAALRDFAGVVVAAKGSFITDRDKLSLAYKKYQDIYNGNSLFMKDDIIIQAELTEGAPDWNALVNHDYLDEPSFQEDNDFVLHLDLGISKDSAGLAVGHIQDYTQMASTSVYRDGGGFIQLDDIRAPIYCIDGIMRIRPPYGGEVHMDLLRGFCFHLCQILNIKIATMDRFESTIFRQGFKKLRVRSGIISTVTTSVPYMEWKTAYIENRIITPRHEYYLQEARDLVYDPKHDRVEHPSAAAGGCFTGDTRVALLDGTDPTFEELAIRYPNGEGFWVYSIDKEEGIIPGLAHHPRITKRVSRLIEVRLDNFSTILCTPEHLFMTPKFEWIMAEKLQEGYSVMPLYRRLSHKAGWKGYTRVYDPIVKGYVFVHHKVCEHFVGDYRKEGYIAHHKDRNKLNNNPDNLHIMNNELHCKIHGSDQWHDSNYVAALRAGHKRYRENGGNEKSRETMLRLFDEGVLKRGRVECLEDGCAKLARARGYCDKHYQHYRRRGFSADNECSIDGCNAPCLDGSGYCDKHLGLNGRAMCCVEGCTNIALNGGLCRTHYNMGYIPDRVVGKNHKIMSIRELAVDVDVWDITVDEYHNFALSSGVFVHNSKDLTDAVCSVVHILQHKVAQMRLKKSEQKEPNQTLQFRKIRFR